MKIKLLTSLLLSSFILSALTAVPSKINYQGLITDSGGDPIESATNSVVVNLYQVETGGTSVYTESFTQVASCLLYTSPSPRDRQKYRMPSSA